MRSFSLRGMATKGFYGPNAKSLGAPIGGGQGNSSGSPTPAFAPVDGGVFPADLIVSMAQLNATNLAVVTDSGNAGVSTDGGDTWTRIAGPLGNITQAVVVLSNTAGTVLVTFGVNGGTRFLSTSTDGGNTWTDVTPAGSNISSGFFYSATANLFFVFETLIAQSWTSPDGITWTARVLPAIFFPVPNVPGVPGMAENGTDIVVQVIDGATNDLLAAHSLDAITWTTDVLFAAQVSSSSGSTYWTGTKFVTQSSPNAVASVWTSNNSTGTAFTLQSSSGDPNIPPYSQQDPFFGGNYYNGFNQNDGVSLAVSPDAVAWTLIDMSAFAYLLPQAIFPAPSNLYVFGSGILQNLTATTFAVALTLSTGFINNMSAGPAGIFAVGSNNTGNGGIWRLVA